MVIFSTSFGFDLMTLKMWSHQQKKHHLRSHVTKGNKILQGPSFLVSIREISGLQLGRNSSWFIFGPNIEEARKIGKHIGREVRFCSRNPSYLKPMHTIGYGKMVWPLLLDVSTLFMWIYAAHHKAWVRICEWIMVANRWLRPWLKDHDT